MRLVQFDADGRAAALDGRYPGLTAAPGWPHADSVIGMSFIDSGGLGFLILDDDDRIAGDCGTKTPTRPDGSVEIGYGLAAPSRGRGLGGRAVAALVSWLAQQPGVTSVEAEVEVTNTPSWRVLERIGFTPVGPESDSMLRYRFDALGHPAEPSPNISLLPPGMGHSSG
ncbi:MAG TPA: GNAT family protein [Mycobacteriales bacterium]|nr:GNAT family protein [Mycobacteriales bacterium]